MLRKSGSLSFYFPFHGICCFITWACNRSKENQILSSYTLGQLLTFFMSQKSTLILLTILFSKLHVLRNVSFDLTASFI